MTISVTFENPRMAKSKLEHARITTVNIMNSAGYPFPEFC
jgi:hypothetical protein